METNNFSYYKNYETSGAKQTSAMQVVNAIFRKFSRSELKSGESLKESALAKEFNVNRAAVREALKKIEGWGIISYKPYCGYKIRTFCAQELLEWYELREALEPIAARRLAKVRPANVILKLEKYLTAFEKAENSNDFLTAKKMDMNFHLDIIKSCKNKCFIHMQNIYGIAALFMLDQISTLKSSNEMIDSTPEHLSWEFTAEEFAILNSQSTVEQHWEMLNAIKNGDAVFAEKIFRLHSGKLVHNVENIILYYGNLSYEKLTNTNEFFIS